MSDNSEIAKLKAQVDALAARVPAKTVGVEPDDVPLTVCNAAADRAWAEIQAEKRDAATLAKEAIDVAFLGRKGAKDQKRTQKALSAVAAERLATATKK